MNGVLYIALSTVVPILAGYFASKKLGIRGAISAPLLSKSSAWLLCLPILLLILFVSAIFNEHFHDRYPIETFCPFILISSAIIGFTICLEVSGKYYFWLRFSCLLVIIFAGGAITLPEVYNNRGALLVLATYFLGMVFGLLLLRSLKRV